MPGVLPGTFWKNTLNSLATLAVAASSPYKPRKRLSKAGTYCDRICGVSRAGSTVTNNTCTLSACGPSSFITLAISAIVVGQRKVFCIFQASDIGVDELLGIALASGQHQCGQGQQRCRQQRTQTLHQKVLNRK